MDEAAIATSIFPCSVNTVASVVVVVAVVVAVAVVVVVARCRGLGSLFVVHIYMKNCIYDNAKSKHP